MTGRSEAMIYVRSLINRTDMGSAKVRGRTSAYAAIHHRSSPVASWQAKSGDPYWMFTVRKRLESKFRVNVRGHIQRFITGTKGVDTPMGKARKMTKAQRNLEKNIGEEPIKAARWGAMEGKRLAPKKTGTLVRAIDWKRIRR
jgi:hypothetical protein